MKDISEVLDEIEKGLPGVTPGPWWAEPEYDAEDRGCSIIAATEYGALPGNPTRGQVAFATELSPEHGHVAEANAAHIARLDPQTMLTIIELARKGLAADAGEGFTLSADLVKQVSAAFAQAGGTALGVAMSGDHHPNPGEALTDVFRVCNEASLALSAAIRTQEPA